jgi:hypothetical protein
LRNYAATDFDTALTTAFTLTLLDDATATEARATLGLPAIAAKGDLIVGTAANTLAKKAAGTDGYGLRSLAATSDGLTYLPPNIGFSLVNGYLDWSVAGSVLTVAIKTWAGTDPSTTDPVYLSFRSATVGTGSLTLRAITAATSISINNTALLGTVDAIPFRLWCVAFDDAGTIRLAIINCLTTSANAGSGRNADTIFALRGWGIASSTLEDNASDSAQVFYSAGAAVTAKAYATLGYATWEAGLATAGTWSAAPTRIQLFGPDVPLPRTSIQTVRTQLGAVISGATAIPADDTIPQNTEGTQAYSLSIVTSSAANVLDVSGTCFATHNTGGGNYIIGALFVDTVANAVAAVHDYKTTDGTGACLPMRAQLLASAIAAVKMRFGNSAGATTYLNGISGGGRVYGGVAGSFLQVEEIMA